MRGPKLVMNRELELYDLSKDPGEAHNLAADHRKSFRAEGPVQRWLRISPRDDYGQTPIEWAGRTKTRGT
jgi:hypothetical protein